MGPRKQRDPRKKQEHHVEGTSAAATVLSPYFNMLCFSERRFAYRGDQVILFFILQEAKFSAMSHHG